LPGGWWLCSVGPPTKKPPYYNGWLVCRITPHALPARRRYPASVRPAGCLLHGCVAQPLHIAQVVGDLKLTLGNRGQVKWRVTHACTHARAPLPPRPASSPPPLPPLSPPLPLSTPSLPPPQGIRAKSPFHLLRYGENSSVVKRLVVSEGREELTTKAATCLLLNSERGAGGGVVVSKEEVAAGRKGSGGAWWGSTSRNAGLAGPAPQNGRNQAKHSIVGLWVTIW
jgi:hypothetical protein